MYEKPVLSQVGKATDVIMGVVSWGIDLDTCLMIDALEYADDSDADQFAAVGR